MKKIKHLVAVVLVMALAFTHSACLRLARSLSAEQPGKRLLLVQQRRSGSHAQWLLPLPPRKLLPN